MYYWRTEELKKELIEGRLTEKDSAGYALLYILLVSFTLFISGIYPGLKPDAVITPWEVVSGLVSFMIILIGFRVAFTVNGGSEGRGFFERYFSIFTVTALRFAAVIFPVYLVWFLGRRQLYSASRSAGSFASEGLFGNSYVFLVAILLTIILCWRVCKHIRDVRWALPPS